MLVLAALATPIRVAHASTINPLDGGAATVGNTEVNVDCVVLPERVGDVWLHFGELVWRWTTADNDESAIVCVDRRLVDGRSAAGGFALPSHGTSGGGATQGGGSIALSAFEGSPREVEAPPSTPVFDDPDASSGNDSLPSPFGTADLPPLTSNDLLFDPSAPDWDNPDGDGDDTIERPIGFANQLDTADLTPVPEPGTWLMLGTGLAAAWRSSRRKR